MQSITLAIPYLTLSDASDKTRFCDMLRSYAESAFVSSILVLHTQATPDLPPALLDAGKIRFIRFDSWFSGSGIERMLDASDARILLVAPPDDLFAMHIGYEVQIGNSALSRFMSVADSTGAALVYSDYRRDYGEIEECQTIDYQLGSVREGFEFGALVLLSKEACQQALNRHGRIDGSVRWAGFYDLRLKLSIDFPVVRIPEPLYSIKLSNKPALSKATAAEKQEDFIDRDGRQYQNEMERVCVAHLRRIGAYIEPRFSKLPPAEGEFPVVASVIIPVRNREGVIAHAVQSALEQSTSFKFNIIAVDDHSTDRTTEVLQNLAAQHKNLIHIIPERKDLNIGGLWSTAVNSPHCGLFAVQLDSDDAFSEQKSLEKIIERFFHSPPDYNDPEQVAAQTKYAMVIGSLYIANARLEPIANKVIDHRGWTSENGPNNALRLNGLGAPRAFYVPALRRLMLPDVSYGEDYAICLSMTREYETARIFEPLYLWRRWEGNSDRSLPLANSKFININDLIPPGGDKRSLKPEMWLVAAVAVRATTNRYNYYKDWLRTMEILIRQQRNRKETLATSERAAPRI